MKNKLPIRSFYLTKNKKKKIKILKEIKYKEITDLCLCGPHRTKRFNWKKKKNFYGRARRKGSNVKKLTHSKIIRFFCAHQRMRFSHFFSRLLAHDSTASPRSVFCAITAFNSRFSNLKRGCFDKFQLVKTIFF